MVERNSSANPVGGKSSARAAPLAVAMVCGLLVILSVGAGFWLGRHESRWSGSGPTTQATPAASTDSAERDDLAKRKIERATRMIILLDKQRNLLDLELNEDILKKMAERELALGGDQIGAFQQWDGKKLQLERLIEDRMRISSELAGLENQRDALTSRLDAGSTPPEIEAQVRNNSRYLELAHHADDAARQVDEMKSQPKPDAALLEAAMRRSTAAGARLDAVHEELRATLANEMKDQLESKISTENAALARVDTFLRQTGDALGVLSQAMADYRVLHQRETHLRQKLEVLSDRITELRMFDLQGIPALDLYRTNPPLSGEWQ